MIEKPELNRKIEFDITPRAFFKIALWLLLIFILGKLLTLITLLFLAVMISVSLKPVIYKFEKYGISHHVSVAIVACVMLSLLGLVTFFLIPTMSSQISMLIKNYPNLRDEILNQIPNDSLFKHSVQQFMVNPKIPATGEIIDHALTVSNYIFTGITEFLLVLLFSVYLLLDGEKAYRWFKDFFHTTTRVKLHQTSDEISMVFLGYVTGQAVTSLLSAIYSYTVLEFLHVPLALTLAVMAGLLDILPVLGFFIAVIPAMLLALTISPVTALYVLGFYILYHIIENYLIVPYVYGNRLEVSSLVVLVALLFAGAVGGVLGAIAVLPIVASYPIIEKIWLAKFLGHNVVEKHAEETSAK